MSILNSPTNEGALPLPGAAMPSRKAGARKVAPQHPGELIGGLLEENAVSIRAAATAIGVSHNALTKVVNAQSPVTVDMALRIGTYFGNGPGLWLNIQQAHDLWHGEAALKAELGKIVPLKA